MRRDVYVNRREGCGYCGVQCRAEERGEGDGDLVPPALTIAPSSANESPALI